MPPFPFYAGVAAKKGRVWVPIELGDRVPYDGKDNDLEGTVPLWLAKQSPILYSFLGVSRIGHNRTCVPVDTHSIGL